MIKLLQRIERLYKSSDDFLHNLINKSDGNEKRILQAILILKNVDIDYGIVKKTVPDKKEKEAKKLIDTAYIDNYTDAILLKIYLAGGYAINITPDFDNLKELFKKLYQETNDKEVKEDILIDFDSFLKKRIATYKEEAREMRYRRLLSTAEGIDLSSYDEACVLETKNKEN